MEENPAAEATAASNVASVPKGFTRMNKGIACSNVVIVRLIFAVSNYGEARGCIHLENGRVVELLRIMQSVVGVSSVDDFV